MDSDINSISMSRAAVIEQAQEIEALKRELSIAETELEKKIKSYVDQNYGYLSERDEKVDKLIVYFRQQEERLSNIEAALAAF